MELRIREVDKGAGWQWNPPFDGFGWLTAGKLTDRTAGEPRFLSPAEGPNPALRRYILEVFLTLNKLI